MTLLDRLLRSIDGLVAGGVLTQNDGSELRTALQTGKVDFRVPKRVRARFRGNEYGLDDFWCTKCNLIWNANDVRNSLRCNKCGSPLIQAYLFVSYFKHKPARSPPLSDMIKSIKEDPNATCHIPKNRGKLKRLYRANVDRPVESLSWKCFEPQANKGCRYLVNDWCAHDIYLQTQYSPVPVRVRFFRGRALLGVGADRSYPPTVPTESITKPILVSVHNYDSDNAEELKIIPELLPECVEAAYYLSRFEAYQFTLGLATGFPSAPLRFRATVLAKDRDIAGKERIVFLSRRLESNGLLLKLKANPSADFAGRVVLHHTVAHAFLKPLPFTVGLDPTEFFESIDVDSSEVVIYDNSPGGIGGVSGVVDNGELRVEYQERLKPMALDCALECKSACKACLFIENCGRLNRQLNRSYLSAGNA